MDSKAFVISVLLTTIYHVYCPKPLNLPPIPTKKPVPTSQLTNKKFEKNAPPLIFRKPLPNIQLPKMVFEKNAALKYNFKNFKQNLNPIRFFIKPFPKIGPLQDFYPGTKCVPKINLIESEKKSNKNPSEKLNQWLKLQGITVKDPGTTTSSLAFEHGGETGGEAISWALGIAAAVGATSGVLSPAVGAFSLIAGIITTINDNRWKSQLIKSMNDAFAQSHERLKQRMTIMEEYVDTNIALLENGLLTGELSHMSQYLTQCLKNKDPLACTLDRCEYVQAGLKKFAIYYDEFTNEEVFKDIILNSEDPDQQLIFNLLKITRNKERLELIKLSKIKRAFANLPLFESFSSGLLYTCETRQFASLIDSLKEQSTKQNIDETKMKEKRNKLQDWLDSFMERSRMVTKYVAGVTTVILSGYTVEYLKTTNSERVLDYGIEERTEKQQEKKVYNLQCRIRMNPFNLETCDYKFMSDLKKEELVKSPDKVNLLKSKCEDEFIQGEENNEMLKKNNEMYIEKAKDMISGFRENVIMLWDKLILSVKGKIKDITGKDIAVEDKKDEESNGNGRNSIMNTEIMNDKIAGVLKKSFVNGSPVQNNPEDL